MKILAVSGSLRATSSATRGTLFNASPGGEYARAWLTETLTVMLARVVFTGQIAADPGMPAALRSALESFAIAIGEASGDGS